MKKIGLIIGAQKSATTTIYNWLKETDKLNVNSRIKELDFFSDQNKFEQGKSFYFTEYFPNSDPENCYIDVSPQYSYSLNCIQNIFSFNESFKFIYIVRDPLERAMSAYSMQKRRGLEKRDFDEAIKDDVDKFNNEGFTNDFGEENYLFVSLYGHILEEYNKVFHNKQFLVISTVDLKNSSVEQYRKICSFLGFTAINIPSSVGKTFHKGGVIKYPFITHSYNFLKKILPYKPKFAKGFGYWLEQWNIKPQNTNLIIDKKLYIQVSKILVKDNNKLSKFL